MTSEESIRLELLEEYRRQVKLYFSTVGYRDTISADQLKKIMELDHEIAETYSASDDHRPPQGGKAH